MNVFRSMGSAAAIALLSVGVAASAPEKPDRWSIENGPMVAASIISECLGESREQSRGQGWSREQSLRQACISRPFDQCSNEHGTQSQRDLTECSGYAWLAWQERLTEQMNRITSQGAELDQSYKADDSARPTAALQASDAAWRHWVTIDCELRALSSVGGTIHSMRTTVCAANHVGARALEIEQLADEWADHPPQAWGDQRR